MLLVHNLRCIKKELEKKFKKGKWCTLTSKQRKLSYQARLKNRNHLRKEQKGYLTKISILSKLIML